MTDTITIANLPAAASASVDHLIPAMKDNVTVYLSAAQIIALVQSVILDGAPGALDTLNELAAALGDDADFAGTVTTALAAKADAAAVAAALADKANTADLGDAAGADILGTVSQTGGNPTGSIIERGSNANGEYVRFADGTQICTHRSLTVATNTVVTMPSAFVNASYIVLPTHRGNSDYILGSQDTDRTTTSFKLRVQDSAASFVTITSLFDYVAIGRWF